MTGTKLVQSLVEDAEMAMSQETLEISILELNLGVLEQKMEDTEDRDGQPSPFTTHFYGKHTQLHLEDEKREGTRTMQPLHFSYRLNWNAYYRITSCATIQIQLSKVTSSTPTTAGLAPNCIYPTRHSRFRCKDRQPVELWRKERGIDCALRVPALDAVMN
ncbi:hypothetical protein NEUTE1DRAFT_115369 [Neurospora tetrasperma FGSC 2508]|uniref:Uncharacterized protein n=1 Tax=Neurospora tetrasperma (strain FGSC 2508 / ATCC MYA-4615 / P0657) TaxID=510951 RepID=F8N4Z8_NEUT8|nr:uncharacterized protein NEUTE1DRAFT_115369 [Neurospora tetrasperma FGSC 2508]EGO53579.1 hypothetical protein NEUTE1DRAFT_115369 [Neurospora tetrasperma FGSC 2508]